MTIYKKKNVRIVLSVHHCLGGFVGEMLEKKALCTIPKTFSFFENCDVFLAV